LLGKLPDWTERAAADTWLDVNAISVITGTHVSETAEGALEFTLDDRLRPQFDLDLFVDGTRIAFPRAEPRTIGSVLLIPLRDVAEALGHTVDVDVLADTVSVTRVQDSARFTLELGTGLVSVNGEPRGITPNISYVDRSELLLPFSAVETLTGSHIVLEPGSDRIDVTLDDRLAGGAMPGAMVDDEAAKTPLTFERLDFQVTDRGALGAALSAHAGPFNTLTRYEAAGSLADPDALQPSWLQMEVQSLSGWYATLGDATPRRRELNGVDTSRIRGATFSKVTDGGKLLSIAAGTTLDGTKAINDDVSVPLFSGFAAGARLIDPDTTREVGLAVASNRDGDGGRAVASIQQEFITENGENDEVGLGGVFVTADVGAFTGDAQDPLGVRGQLDGVYRLSRRSNLRASVSHESSSFRQGSTRAKPDLEGVFDTRVSGRTNAQMSVDWRAVDNWDLLENFGAGARVSTTREGERTSTALAGSASARLADTGVFVSVDAGVTSTTDLAGDGNITAGTLAIRAQRAFDWGEVNAVLNSDETELGRATRLVANIGFNPITRRFENGAAVVLTPSISAVATDTTQFARVGASARATSGEAFGENLLVTGQVSALQSVSSVDARTDFFGSLSARYRVWDALSLQGAVNTNFVDQTRFTLGLQGSIEFNEPRKHTQPNEGTGVLSGRVYLDRNRDGIRQEDEPGIPGVRVAVRNSRLALRVDNRGSYTIQNMPTGLYTLDIDVQSLPLGMLANDLVTLRATIGDGRVTHLDIPVISSGQIRGAVFVDDNGNGVADSGETRLEGARLTLSSPEDKDFEPIERVAAGFGQYAFEGLSPGAYQITVQIGELTQIVEVALSEDELFITQPVAMPGQKMAPESDEFEGQIEFIARLEDLPETQA
ncbi:MAG: SdrD B-like domain-containing protein, partial [Pseudomonadota bacterium]